MQSQLTIDRDDLYRVLNQTGYEYSLRVKRFVEGNPAFAIHYGDEETPAWRTRVHGIVDQFLDGSIITLEDLRTRPSRFFKLCQQACWVDGSVGATLFAGYLIFGGSLVYLGTDRHTHLHRDVDTFTVPGCFAMTEVGHGSNLRGLETEARYDAEAKEFVVNTPSWKSAKWAIALAAWNARLVTVLARLILPGGQDKGIHAFLVPVRDTSGELLPGVSIADCDRLIGLNGVGIGGLAFRDVRIPRENLLNRFCDVQPDGTFVAANPGMSSGDLFNATVGPLTIERLVPFSTAATKLALTIAVRFAHTRKQFGPRGASEVPIFQYVSHQRRLLPGIARTYAISLLLEHLHARLDGFLPGELPRSFQALCAGYKAVSYEYAIETVRTARECCSVHSFRHANKIARAYLDINGFSHAAGDNIVLLQHAARTLLEGDDGALGGTLAVHGAGPRPPELERRQQILDARWKALRAVAREEIMKHSSSMNLFEAWNLASPFAIKMVRGYVEALLHRTFADEVARAEGTPNAEVLGLLCQLYGHTVIADDLGWFCSADAAGPAPQWSPVELEKTILDLCSRLAPVASQLVDAFGVPEPVLPAAELTADIAEKFPSFD